MKNEVLLKKSEELAENAIDLYQLLDRKNFKSIANQILKCGTSVGANINESCTAESIPDFIHKISIANKELSEFEYWVKLCRKKNLVIIDEEIFKTVLHLQKTITKLIYTSKKEIARREEIKKKKK